MKITLILLSGLFIATLLIGSSSPTNYTPALTGRIAVSHDGNFHDTDDYGAVAMVEALVWQNGSQSSLVHIEHSSHIGANISSHHTIMIDSANDNAGTYQSGPPGFDLVRGVVNDYFANPVGTEEHFAEVIEDSSATDVLIIIQAGPWESMARAYDGADPLSHRYTHIVSHSDWNDEHEHASSHRTKIEFFAQYDTGGIYQGYAAPQYTRIDNQNGEAFKSPMTGNNSWDWLTTDPNMDFVRDRTLLSVIQGDMSDAGMVFWCFTGNQNPTMSDIRTFFGL